MREAFSTGSFVALLIVTLIAPIVGFIVGGLSLYWQVNGSAHQERGRQGLWLVLVAFLAFGLWLAIG